VGLEPAMFCIPGRHNQLSH